MVVEVGLGGYFGDCRHDCGRECCELGSAPVVAGLKLLETVEAAR